MNPSPTKSGKEPIRVEPKRIIKTWRNTIRVVITDDFGHDQIEIQRYNKLKCCWEKSNYFRTLHDFDDYVDFLVDSGDAIEAAGFVGNPRVIHVQG